MGLSEPASASVAVKLKTAIQMLADMGGHVAIPKLIT